MLASAPGAIAMAGGLDVVNRMKDGLTPPVLVMLGDVANIDAIEMSPERDVIEIGAGTRHDALAHSEVVLAHLPDLARCWDRIANVRIRMQGTVAGNLLALMPGYEGSILLSALGVSMQYSTRGSLDDRMAVRDLGDTADSFFARGGLAEKVRVPLPGTGTNRRLFYDRSLRPALSVALCIDDREGAIVSARAVIGGCHRWPFTCDLPLADVPLSGLRLRADAVAKDALRQMPVPTVPCFGVAKYRETVASVLLSRLIQECAA